MNLLKLYLKLLSSEALVRQDLEGPGNVKGARDHSASPYFTAFERNLHFMLTGFQKQIFRTMTFCLH